MILGAVFLLACGLFFYNQWLGAHPNDSVIRYNDMNIIIADTETEREQGLSGRVSLDSNTGMMFVFPESGYYKFWMRDMLFPLDIIYLDSHMRIVQVFSNVQPQSYPETIVSDTPAQYVLEMNAGQAVNKGFTVGSVLHLKNFIPH